MKKIISLALMMAISVAVVSCSGGSGDGVNPLNPDASESQLIGKWLHTGNAGEGTTMDAHMLMVLSSELAIETYMLTGENSSEYYTKCVSTYSISGNKLMTKAANCEGGGKIEDSEVTYSISNDKLTLVDDNETIVFSKWNGETSNLSLIKQQAIPTDERMAPQVSINTNPAPSHFLFIKMP